MHIIYRNYATSSQGALNPSKQAFLNMFKWSQPYKSCFRNKNMLIAYWRKVETHSQSTKYKLFTSLRNKSFFSFQNSNYMLRHHICVSLYKIQIAFTNHDSTSSKFQQIPINRSCFIHISRLSTKVKYKRTCFQNNSPYYTLQPTRVLKVSANSRNKINEKKGGLKGDQD